MTSLGCCLKCQVATEHCQNCPKWQKYFSFASSTNLWLQFHLLTLQICGLSPTKCLWFDNFLAALSAPQNIWAYSLRCWPEMNGRERAHHISQPLLVVNTWIRDPLGLRLQEMQSSWTTKPIWITYNFKSWMFQVLVYHPANDIWETSPRRMPTPRADHIMAVWRDRVYFCGGWWVLHWMD